MSDVEYGRAGEQDLEPLLALINLVQPHVPWDARRLRWQFFDGPAGPARLYVVRDTERIVSLYVAVPYTCDVAGEERRSFMIQDVMTHPDYRGRGLLHQLGRVCLAELGDDFGHTFPNERSEGSFRRNGWTELCRVPQWTRPLTEADGGEPDLEPWSGPFDASADAIWHEAGLDVGVRRDARYLEWRYGKPGVAYLRRRIDGDRGLLVLKPFGGRLHICELIVRESAHQLLGGVIRACAATARELGADTLTAWLPPLHPYAPALAASGFAFEPSPRTVFVTGPQRLLPLFADARRWHLTHGDSDVY